MGSTTIERIMDARHDPLASKVIYDEIIENYRRNRVDIHDVYYEKHHVVPRMLGGGDEATNIVPLPAIVHFDCHLLLVFINADAPEWILAQLKGAVTVLVGRHKYTFEQVLGDPAGMRLRYGAIREICDQKYQIVKAELLDMIARGEPRPHRKTKLGRTMCMYLCEQHRSHRPQLKPILIHAGADHWFNDDRREATVQAVRKLAQDGEARPNIKTHLGHVLARLVSPKNADFRPELREELLRLRPDWFILGKGGRKPNGQRKFVEISPSERDEIMTNVLTMLSEKGKMRASNINRAILPGHALDTKRWLMRGIMRELLANGFVGVEESPRNPSYYFVRANT